MSSETEDTETPAEETSAEDPFEVKWRKKAERPAASQNVATAEDTGDVATLQQELETERQRTKDLQDRWQRAAADLANLRRRTEQDKGEIEKFANMLLVQELLPVLDNFERALTAIPGNLAMLTWIQGVMLIERHLRAILEHQGLAPIEAQGQSFNPQMHEAIAEVETADASPGTVVREYQKGYTMHGRVIRPALVEIAKEASQSESDADQEQMGARSEVAEEVQTEHIADAAESENVGP